MKSKTVQVYSASGQLAGEMIRLLLESMNITAFVVQESAGVTYGLTVGPLGEVKVYVPEDQVDQALEVIAAMEKGDLNTNNYPGLSPGYPELKNNKSSPEEMFKE